MNPWVRWIPPVASWVAFAYYLYGIDKEHVRLLIIVTVAVWVAATLSRRRRKVGEKSAYAMMNPNGERLDGDMTLAAFGLKDVGAASRGGKPATSGSPQSPTTAVPRTTIARYEAVLVDSCFGGDGERFHAYLDELASPGCKVKAHHKCPCGGGKRFASCCSELQLHLRVTRYGR